MDDSSDFWSAEEQRRGLGDKIAYDFTNTVDWLGGFVQGEYATDRFTTYGMAGLSTIRYAYTNHFVDDGGRELHAETASIVGYQVKGGGLYNLGERLGLFANVGYVSKVPIFDGVIDDVNAAINPDPTNEEFISLEAGAEVRLFDGLMSGTLNAYRTAWNDRTYTRNVMLEDGTEGLVNLTGLDAIHQGIELELAYQPTTLFRLDAAASIGDWHYTNDVTGTYRPDDRSSATETFNFYVSDLKVGDAPQTQLAYAATVFPMPGMYVKVLGKTYANHYAAFNPFSRTSPEDRAQSWKAPGYTVFDAHAGYDLPLSDLPIRARVFAHLLNAFDELYIQDAVDNSAFNAFAEDGMHHRADDAEVYVGMPRRIRFGLSIQY